MLAAQIASLSLSATISFLIVRSCAPAWKVLLGALTGFAASWVAGVVTGTLFFKPDTDILLRLIITAFWFSLFGVIAGSLYGRHSRPPKQFQ